MAVKYVYPGPKEKVHAGGLVWKPGVEREIPKDWPGIANFAQYGVVAVGAKAPPVPEPPKPAEPPRPFGPFVGDKKK